MAPLSALSRAIIFTTMLACAFAQQPQLRTNGGGALTAVATDLQLSPTGGGPVVSLAGVASAVTTAASNMAIVAGNISNLDAAISTGQGQLQLRANSFDMALQANRLERAAMTSSMQGLVASMSSLESRLVTIGNEISALANVVHPASCPLSAMSGWQQSFLTAPATGYMGMRAVASATSAAGSNVPVGGAVVFSVVPGYFFATTSTTVTCNANGGSQTGTWSGPAPSATACLSGCQSCSDATTCNACAAGRTITFVPSTPYPTRTTVNPALVTYDPIGLYIYANNAAGRLTRYGDRGATMTTAARTSAGTFLTNGSPDTRNYRLGPQYMPRMCANPAWIQLDLGTNMRVGSVSVWHYWLDQREYCGQRIAISTTGQFTGEEVEIFNSGLQPHAESPSGLTVPANGTVGRYVRHWAAGSDRNRYVHFVEFDVSAVAANAPGSIQCLQ